MWSRFTIPLVRLDSIDTLKQDAEYRTHLENAFWDINVIDETIKNIGDPSALMGVYDIEAEERIVADAIEQRISEAEFENILDQTAQAAMENIGSVDAGFSAALRDFYVKCLKYSRPSSQQERTVIRHPCSEIR